MPALEDDVIIVTGASGALGREMALRYSAEGGRVTLAARSTETLEDIAAEASGETLVSTTDLRDPDEVARTVERTVEEWGRVDTLVNNAGVGQISMGMRPLPVGDVDLDVWNTILETNLRGAFLCSNAVLPHMVEQERGNIVNITSGLQNQPIPGWGPYIVSKFGLAGLTEVMALEYYRDGINVNLLFPGARVESDFWPHLDEDQLADPDIMNDAAVALAAQEPRGITGEAKEANSWEYTLGY